MIQNVQSPSFKMSISGLRTYDIYLSANFGDRSTGNSTRLAGIYICASSHESRDKIFIQGSSITLLNTDQYRTESYTFDSDDAHVLPGSGLGSKYMGSRDITEDGFITNNNIQLDVTVKIASGTGGAHLDLATYR